MCRVAQNYGSRADFTTPSMSTRGFGGSLSALSNSLTASQLKEIRDNKSFSLPPQRIRPVQRENVEEIPLLTECVTSNEFEIYTTSQNQIRHMRYVITVTGRPKQLLARNKHMCCLTKNHHLGQKIH